LILSLREVFLLSKLNGNEKQFGSGGWKRNFYGGVQNSGIDSVLHSRPIGKGRGMHTDLKYYDSGTRALWL
jgi:hypothetical protein